MSKRLESVGQLLLHYDCVSELWSPVLCLFEVQ